jgi:hypothetical protein
MAVDIKITVCGDMMLYILVTLKMDAGYFSKYWYLYQIHGATSLKKPITFEGGSMLDLV